MKGHTILFCLGLICFASHLFAQEKLQVDGLIHSQEGGFKFPDNTIQTTAASQLRAGEVSAPRGQITVQFEGIMGVPDRTEYNVLDVYFCNRDTVSQGGGGGASSETLFGNIRIITDVVDSTFGGLFFANAAGSDITSVLLKYYDEQASLYVTIELTTSQMLQFKHFTQPFSSDSFGYLIAMFFDYEQIEVCDANQDNCKCWDVMSNQECGGG